MKRARFILATLAILCAPTAAQAVGSCSARVHPRTGVVLVSANGLAGTLSWGEQPGGPYQHGFYNSGQHNCRDAEGSVMLNCQLDELVEDARIPTVDCMLYLRDNGAECATWIKGCSPMRGGDGDWLDPEDKAVLTNLLGHIAVGPDANGHETVFLTAANLDISNAWGTEVADGTGNLFLGRSCPSGNCGPGIASHFLSIGKDNIIDGWTGLVVGDGNYASGDTPVAIGFGHDVVGYYSAAFGGTENAAGGPEVGGGGPIYATCVGGIGQTCMGYGATGVGTFGSTVTGVGAVAVGGGGNAVHGDNATMLGGTLNTITAAGDAATVEGGSNRTIGTVLYNIAD